PRGAALHHQHPHARPTFRHGPAPAQSPVLGRRSVRASQGTRTYLSSAVFSPAMTSKIAGLYAIADTRCLNASRLLPAVRNALDAGAGVIQYRDKSDDSERRAHEARALAACCRARGVLFLINDDVDLAVDVNANGVHL